MPQHLVFFGHTSDLPLEVSLEISAIASLTVGVDQYEQITVSANSIIDRAGGFDYDSDASLVASIYITTTGGDDFNDNATLEADTTLDVVHTYEANGTITLAAVSNITHANVLDAVGNLTLTAAHTINLTAGYELEVSLNLNTLADFILLPGTGHDDSLTLEAEALATATETITYGNVLSIEAVADIALEEVLEPGGLLTIAASAAITVEALQDYDINLPIEAIALFYPENVFDFVTSGNDAQAAVIAALEYIAGAPFTTAASVGVIVEVSGEYSKVITDSISFTDSVHITRSIITITDSISFTDSQNIQKVVVLDITDTLVFTDQAYRVYPFAESIVFSDSIIVQRIQSRNFSDTLSLVDTLARQLTLNIGITDTIVFGEGRVYDSPLNGQSLLIPAVVINVIQNKCQFVLTVPQRSILLPCPLWGDQQTYMGQVTIKKTTTGDTYSYIRQTDLRKLQYVFKVDTQKRIELYEFLKSFSAEFITVNNHKGERWRAQLTNNPFSFDSRSRYAPRRESFDVTLEFEGIRIG